MPTPSPSLVPADDPTGNSQPAWRIDADGVTSNTFLVQHGGQGLKLVRANAPGDASPTFELDGNGKLVTEG